MLRPAMNRRARSLTTHLLIRITAVGLLCWLGVTGAVVWQLQREGRESIEQQADRLQALTELQLRRQLIALESGSRVPDLARVAAVFGRPVCLRYRTADGQAVDWACETVTDPPAIPRWLDRWIDRHAALPRQEIRTIHLWSHEDGTLTVEPLRTAVLESLWLRLRDLTGLTAATIGAVNLLVLLTLRRLLRPTADIVAALDRLSEGDLSPSPTPPQGALEFRHIGAGLAHLREALAQLTAQRSALTARLIDSQETERRDLARDLHDELGQCLAALQAVSSGIRMSAQAGEAARPEDTETLDATIAQMLDGLRVLLARLRPPLLESQGLAFALQELTGRWNSTQRCATGTRQRLHAELRLPAVWPTPLPDALSLGLYRATQEALTNAARYAAASAPVVVEVSTDTETARLRLRVHNACTSASPVSQGSRLGLRMLAERIQSLGGELHAGPTPDGHFTLRADWPLRTEPSTT